MLDENLRVLGRRINDLELDIQEKKERLALLRKEKEELVNVLDKIDHEHHGLRGELEEEMKLKLEDKQKELRHLKSELQSCEHRHALEVEQLKNSNRNDLEMIQEKVQMAMAKKKEIIDALHAETQMKDVQVIKLKEMLERQRRELLLGK
jgi:chromosome segregation ATPase